MSNASPKAGLRMIALLEGAKGMLVLAAGLGLFALAHRDLQSMAEQLVSHLHLNPARHLPRIFLHLAANLSDRRLWLFAFAAIIYSTISFVEAYGLWHDWKWMKWFAALSVGIYIPPELGELLYHFSWAKLILFGANAFVVAFILLQLAFARGRNLRNQPKPLSEVNSPPAPFTRSSQRGQQWSQVGGAGGSKTSRTTARSNQVIPQCETCPLNRVQAGVAVRIKKLCASPEIQIRLRELGFCEEQIIRLLRAHTNYICQVCNTRLALSRTLAELILVEPLGTFAQPLLAPHRHRVKASTLNRRINVGAVNPGSLTNPL